MTLLHTTTTARLGLLRRCLPAIGAALLGLSSAVGAQPAVDSFTTPGAHNWVVPANVTSVEIVVVGGGGGGGETSAGGSGAIIASTVPFAVVAGDTLNLFVGGGGKNAFFSAAGGGGGGSSKVVVGATPIIIAGGGGGAGYGGSLAGAGGDGGPIGGAGGNGGTGNGTGWDVFGGGKGGGGGIGGDGGTTGTPNDGDNGVSGYGGRGGYAPALGDGGYGNGSGRGGDTNYLGGGGGGGYGGGGGGGGDTVGGGGGGGGSLGPAGFSSAVAGNGGGIDSKGGAGFITITYVTTPSAPAAATATAGNTTASVSFVAPADNGSAITGYTVVSIPAGGVDSNAGSTALTHNITGLVNGTAYTFKVTATNGAGTSSASPASNSVTPVGAPATPAAPTATAGNTTASVTFLAPADNGSAITGYTVVSSPAGGVDSNAGSTSLTHSITGLTNGTAYTFTVTATNGLGTSSASAASNSVTPAAAPGTPAAPTATAGNTTASVTFTAPANNGSAITGYTVVSIPAGGVDSNAGTTGLTHSITGLTNGTAYTFTVTATNGVGTSSASAASNSVTPAAAPGTPAAPSATAGDTAASVTFVAPANNGSAITGYTVVSIPAGGVDSNAGSTALTHTITGLVNGTAYTFKVTATNGVGTSSASPASNSVTPVAPDTTPAIPLLPVTIPGIGAGSLPSILNMGAGDGPVFMGQLVGLLSREVGSALRFVEQNATGTVSLGGYNGGNLAFLPHSFQAGDFRTNGIYPTGNGQYQVVVNGQSISIAPSVVRLDQLAALVPGVTASMADTGVITATLNGTTFVMQPGVAVQLNPPTGQSSLVLGDDGMYRFTDALGNTQILYPAFAAPAILRNVLQSIDPAATVSVALDATASVVLHGVRYTLVPDLTLGGVPTEQLGKRYWPDGANRYRMWVSIGQSQEMVLRP